jgi:hypothetical protein
MARPATAAVRLLPGMAKPCEPNKSYSQRETIRRRDAVVRRALNTPRNLEQRAQDSTKVKAQKFSWVLVWAGPSLSERIHREISKMVVETTWVIIEIL